MTNPTFDFNSFLDAGKKAFAPVVKFNELSVQSFERIARQQYAFAGEADRDIAGQVFARPDRVERLARNAELRLLQIEDVRGEGLRQPKGADVGRLLAEEERIVDDAPRVGIVPDGPG